MGRPILHETKEISGIPVADRPVPRWLIVLSLVVFSWIVYYMITFGTQYAGVFPRPERPGGATTTSHGG